MTSQEFRNYLAAGIVCDTLWPGVEEEKWKTLFEGNVTTRDNTSFTNGAIYTFDTALLISPDETVRLTVNNISFIYTVINLSDTPGDFFYHWEYFGNLWLCRDPNKTEYIDDGNDYAVETAGFIADKFFTRTPGTYQIRIERKVT